MLSECLMKRDNKANAVIEVLEEKSEKRLYCS